MTEESTGSLDDFVEVCASGEDDWRLFWGGMPEYVQETEEWYHSMTITFGSDDDLPALSEILEQEITPKTKTAYFPERKPELNRLSRWIYQE